MDADAEVEAQDEEVQVIAYAYAGAEGDGLAEVGHVDFAAGLLLIVTDEPDVAGVNEGGAVQVGDDGEAVFDVGFELEVAGLVDV